jgi:predicted phage-related endonuclease
MHSTLKMLSACLALVEDDIDWASSCSHGRVPALLIERLEQIRSRAVLVQLIAEVALSHIASVEQPVILRGTSRDDRANVAKRLPILTRRERHDHDSTEETAVTELINFPAPTSDHTVPAAPRPASGSAPTWPALAELGLGGERLEVRRKSIGGSDANIILSGDRDRIYRLWQEKRALIEPEDLSGKISVMLGSWTEAFNRQWYERLTGNRIIGAGTALTCPRHGWRTCTLDGIVEKGSAVFEAKHTNAFVKNEEVLERYMPQLQHNMAVANADRAILSVIFGNARYETFEVASDWLYQLDLFKAEKSFLDAVLSGKPPVAAPPPPAPRPVATRELSFQGNNAWASAAADWLENFSAAKAHAAACKSLKELIDEDVARAFGHGIEAKRSKAGAITIRTLA